MLALEPISFSERLANGSRRAKFKQSGFVNLFHYFHHIKILSALREGWSLFLNWSVLELGLINSKRTWYFTLLGVCPKWMFFVVPSPNLQLRSATAHLSLKLPKNLVLKTYGNRLECNFCRPVLLSGNSTRSPVLSQLCSLAGLYAHPALYSGCPLQCICLHALRLCSVVSFVWFFASRVLTAYLCLCMY